MRCLSFILVTSARATRHESLNECLHLLMFLSSLFPKHRALPIINHTFSLWPRKVKTKILKEKAMLRLFFLVCMRPSFMIGFFSFIKENIYDLS